MSFSGNPYAMMELITAPPKAVFEQVEERVREYWTRRGLGAVDVHCSSCGAQDVSKGTVTISSPIALARQHFDKHVRDSHGYDPQNMVDHRWSWEV